MQEFCYKIHVYIYTYVQECIIEKKLLLRNKFDLLPYSLRIFVYCKQKVTSIFDHIAFIFAQISPTLEPINYFVFILPYNVFRNEETLEPKYP